MDSVSGAASQREIRPSPGKSHWARGQILANATPLLAVAVLLLSGWVALRSLTTRNQFEYWEKQSFLVMQELDDLFAALQGAERSERAFLTTGDKEGLLAYYASLGRVNRKLASLEEAGHENPRRWGSFLGLTAVVRIRLAEIQEVLDACANRVGSQFSSSDAGRAQRLMSEVLAMVAQSCEAQSRRFQERTQAKEASARLVRQTLFGGALLSISLLLVGFLVLKSEVTQRKRAEQALREARDQLAHWNGELERRVQERTASLGAAIAQMEEFSYSVSHDLRAPARAMQGYALALLEDYGGRLDAQGRDFLERIGHAAARMDQLMQDVLIYSRVARCEIQLQPVCLHRLVHEIIQLYPALQSPRAKIILGPLTYVLGHEPSLTQAISNLLSNAVKFVEPGIIPEVRLWTERRANSVRLWVADNGIGIKPEHQKRLFGMFERVRTAHAYEGTGIGLAIVRKAAERMGGSVGLESDGVSGSRFWIELAAAIPVREIEPAQLRVLADDNARSAA